MNTDQHQTGEIVIQGQAASPGYAVGPVSLFNTRDVVISTDEIGGEETGEEFAHFTRARRIVVLELRKIAEITSDREEDARKILEAHIQIAEDPELEKKISQLIHKKRCRADRAVNEAFSHYIQAIKNTGNALMIDRIADLIDIRDRLVRQIQHGELVSGIAEGSVVVCDVLMPSDILHFSRHNVIGIAANEGGLTAHATIIANAMGIPLVINAVDAVHSVLPGEVAIIDGIEGKVILRPRKSTLRHYDEEILRHREEIVEISEVIELAAETKCGTEILLRANIEFEEELENIGKYRTRGVGLLRTESFFLEDEQLGAYKIKEEFFQKAVKASGGDSVTIRLFDVGGDKFTDSSTNEANPFLGWRGIRVLLDRRQVLRSQLRAILNVAGRNPGKIRILIPMVSVLEEILEIKAEVLQLTEIMKRDGLPYDPHLEIGVMIEVPSTALIADKIAGEVDFFSIGTNDLTQYTLAVDRGNWLISRLYQQLHPSVFRLIKMTADAAERHGKDIAVCGELASNPDAALCLIGIGIHDLSMSAASLPRVKAAIRKYTVDEMTGLSEKILEAAMESEVRTIIKKWKQNNGKPLVNNG
jgi:phosphoenolpyruvate-protein phosphotransferase (PTS system enzyme I)